MKSLTPVSSEFILPTTSPSVIIFAGCILSPNTLMMANPLSFAVPNMMSSSIESSSPMYLITTLPSVELPPRNSSCYCLFFNKA